MEGELTYRLAADSDFPTLMQYRRECGWGEQDLEQHWNDPDRVYCVFAAVIDGELQDVGMGCWYLNMPEDPELANREARVIRICMSRNRVRVRSVLDRWLTGHSIAALFIRQIYQGRSFGARALEILEHVAVERYGAVKVTLDTAAYTTSLHALGHRIEHFDKSNRTIAWYEAKGYRQFRVGPEIACAPRVHVSGGLANTSRQANRPKYPEPTPEDKNYLLTATFLDKSANTIRQRSSVSNASSEPSNGQVV